MAEPQNPSKCEENHIFSLRSQRSKKSNILSLAAATDTHFLSLESATFGQLGTDLSLQRTELDGFGDSTVWATRDVAIHSQTLRKKIIFFPTFIFLFHFIKKKKVNFFFSSGG